MQSYETPETVVHEPLSEEDVEAQAKAKNSWGEDQPIYLTLAGSALAAAAAVPVIVAVMGPMAMLPLMRVAVLVGLLVGMTGLFVVGSAVSLKRLVRDPRRGQATPKTKPRRGLRGKLAFG